MVYFKTVPTYFPDTPRSLSNKRFYNLGEETLVCSDFPLEFFRMLFFSIIII